MSLDRIQSKAIGKDYGFDIYHPLYASLHPVADIDSYYDDEDDQTYDEFVSMSKRNPNIKGTGRWKLNSQRNKMLVLCASNDNNHIIWANQLCLLLKPFFQLDIDIHFIDNQAFDLKQKAYFENGMKYDLRFLNLKKSINRNKKKIIEVVDVFSLFDIFCMKSCRPYITSILLVDFTIAEQGDNDGDEAIEVLGRACGDRICCVSFNKNQSRKDFFATCLHEICHTIGFDHCKSFKCVMNAIVVIDSYLFLSPPNIRKLKLFLSIPETNTTFVLDRYLQLLNVYQSLPNTSEFEEDIAFIEQKCNLIRSITHIK